MPQIPLHYQSALQTANQIHKGERSSVEVTEALLGRIAEVDTTLQSYVTVVSDAALEQARLADEEIGRGNIKSVLHGVPIAVKDLLDTAGVKTTYGMKIYEDNFPSKDAGVVAKLKDAGTVLLGKLKLTEGAYAQHHPDVAPPLNPWNHDCWTGVSSSGSGVATAAGLCFASIGSDTGGSIRFPSAANGLAGLKPTWGRVSRAGVFPLAYTLDHLGPMTRTVRDSAAMLGIIAGRDDEDPTSSHREVDDYLAAAEKSIAGLRVGIDSLYNSEDVDGELISAIEEVVRMLAESGCKIVDIKVPYHEMSNGWPVTCSIETAHAHKETYPSRADEYGSISQLIEFGRSLSAEAYLEQEIKRRSFRAALDDIFSTVDLILCPSMSFASLPKEGSPEAIAAERNLAVTLKFTAPFDFSGSPTLSIPWGIGSAGIPLSVQLVARDFEEATLITAGACLEGKGGHAESHPDI